MKNQTVDENFEVPEDWEISAILFKDSHNKKFHFIYYECELKVSSVASSENGGVSSKKKSIGISLRRFSGGRKMQKSLE